MKFNKDDLYSLLGSVGFHLLILLVLSLTILSTVVPEEDSGVLVNLGNVDEAAGTFEPLNTGQEPMEETTPPPPPTPTVETAKEELVTQDVEESVALAEAKKKKEEQRKKEEAIKREQDRIQKEKLEQQRLADAQRQKELAIKNKVAGAFGAGSAAGSSQGSGETGSGNQGSPFGNSDHGANSGVGGYGSVSLNGRQTIGLLPKPEDTGQQEGQIVIEIKVNWEGVVTEAKIGKGTKIDDQVMRNSAIKAALKAKFEKKPGSIDQIGTITYRYKFK
jgi:TonB family protein